MEIDLTLDSGIASEHGLLGAILFCCFGHVESENGLQTGETPRSVDGGLPKGRKPVMVEQLVEKDE